MLNQIKNNFTTKKQCPKCGREITIINFNKHFKVCNKYKKQTNKEVLEIASKCIIKDNKYICPICNKEYSKKGIFTHIWRKHTKEGLEFDPNKSYEKGTKVVWNKGLTKETDERVKKCSETYSKNAKLGLHKKPVAKNIESWKKNISIGINKAIQNSPDSYNGHFNRGFVKEYIYNNIKLLGTWELKFAIWCDKNNIKWIKNKDYFEYFYLNKSHKYFPDFYLPEFNEYVEIKGYKTIKDVFKWKQFPSNKKLNILLFDKLKILGILNIISDDDISKFMVP